MTPIPGKSFKVIFPFTTSTPLKRSLEISKLPSRSAKSTNGENCEAAEIAHEVSVCLLYTYYLDLPTQVLVDNNQGVNT